MDSQEWQIVWQILGMQISKNIVYVYRLHLLFNRLPVLIDVCKVALLVMSAVAAFYQKVVSP